MENNRDPEEFSRRTAERMAEEKLGPTFAEELVRRIRESGQKDSAVYREAGIDWRDVMIREAIGHGICGIGFINRALICAEMKALEK